MADENMYPSLPGSDVFLPTAQIAGKQQQGNIKQEVSDVKEQVVELVRLSDNLTANINHIAGNQKEIKEWFTSQQQRDENMKKVIGEEIGQALQISKQQLDAQLECTFNKMSMDQKTWKQILAIHL